MRRLAIILIFITVVIAVLQLLLFFANELSDTYFYWAIGSYFRNGVYPFSPPFVYDRATTISPPLYGLFLVLFDSISKRPDIIMHALQTVSLFVTGYLIYMIIKTVIGKYPAIIMACIYILIPTNLIFTSLLYTENFSGLGLVFYVYLLFSYFRKKNSLALFTLVLLGCALTLLKYFFVIFGILGFIILFIERPKILSGYILPVAGVMIIFVWILINHQITGVWGLSDTKGVQLWNLMSWRAQALPPESDPTMIRLRTYIPKGMDLHQGYWNYQFLIGPKVGNNWSRIDNILGDVARRAVRLYPQKYLKTGIGNFFQLLLPGVPYYETLYMVSKPNSEVCRDFGNYRFCEPIIKFQNSYFYWNSYVKFDVWLHMYIFPVILLLLFLPSLVILFLAGDKFEKYLSVAYIIGIFAHTFFVHLETRYLAPFYPVIFIITIFGIHKAYEYLRAIIGRERI